MAHVITNFNDIKPELIELILRNNDLIGQAAIRSIKILLSKELQVSRVARLGIEYSSDAPPTAPATVFLKLSKASESQLSNKSEIEFYRDVGKRNQGWPLVRCFEAVYDADYNTSHILMEDLSDTHLQSPDGEAPSPELSELAVKCLAKFHAVWWNHPEVGKSIGTVFDEAWLKAFLLDLRLSIENFSEFMGGDLSPERRTAYKFLLSQSREIWGRLTIKEGLTVTHGDIHWWNFLFPRNQRLENTRIIDWQLWHVDLGVRDLAFLIALGGFAEPRPEIEMQLVRLYFETLTANGVSGYEWSEFWADYRLSAIRNINIPVVFWAQGRGRETYLPLLDRAFEAFDRLGCSELF